jgi:plastocyanin
VALTGAYDNASQSVDGEAQVRLGMGKAALLGVARAFSSGYGADGRVALGGGAVLPLGGTFALAGDVITLLNRSDAEKVAWSAGLQIRIPYTPHSLSLQATNTNTATLEGSSRGGDKTRYGFEFTIPVTLSRYLHRGGGAAAGQAVTATNADSVVVTIRDFEFSPAQVTIRPGATVVFVNAGQVAAERVSLHAASVHEGHRGRLGRWPVSPGMRVPVGLVAGVLAALAVGTACFSEHGADLTGLPSDCQTVAKNAGVTSGVVIGIKDFVFSPANVQVQKGETVTWVNCEGDPSISHTATAKDRSWTSPNLVRGQTYSRVFTAAATIDYFCVIHPSMQAELDVQ